MKPILAMLMILLLALGAGAAGAENTSYGGEGDDVALGMIALADGGYLIYGSTTSIDGDFARPEGDWMGEAPWAMRLDENGNVLWQHVSGQYESGGKPLRYTDAAELADGRIAMLLPTGEFPTQCLIQFLTAEGVEVPGVSYACEPLYMGVCAAGNNLIAIGAWNEGKDLPAYLYLRYISEDGESDWQWRDEDMRPIACAGLDRGGEYIYAAMTIRTDDHPHTQSLLLVTGEGKDDSVRTAWSSVEWGDLRGGGLYAGEDSVAYVRQSPAEEMRPDGVTNVILYDELVEAIFWQGSLNENTFSQVLAMPVCTDAGFVLVGYVGGAGESPELGDEALAQYVSHADGFSGTCRQSNPRGGARFVDAAEKDGMIVLLGVRDIGDDRGVDVFMDTWAYLRRN